MRPSPRPGNAGVSWPASPASSGIGEQTLRNWVRQAEIDVGSRQGVTTEDKGRIAELEKELRELRRANAMAASTGGRNELCVLLQWCQIAEGESARESWRLLPLRGWSNAKEIPVSPRGA